MRNQVGRFACAIGEEFTRDAVDDICGEDLAIHIGRFMDDLVMGNDPRLYLTGTLSIQSNPP